MDNSNSKLWKSDIKDWTKLDSHAADLYISQAEMRLKETIDTYNISSVRTDSYLKIAITLMSVSIGYVFTGTITYLQTTAFFAIIPIVYAIYYLWQNLKSYTVYTPGDIPKVIFTSKFVDGFEPAEQYLTLVFFTMETIQYKIEQNYIVNLKRLENNANARTALILTPIIAFLCAAIYLYFLGFQLAWVYPNQ